MAEVYYDSSLTGEQLDKALTDIPANVERSEVAVKDAESWAHGGTGVRGDEETDNAKYWAGQSKADAGVASGAANTAAQAAEEAGKAKEYAAKPPIIRQNEAGDYTWWVWNADEGDYVDSFAPAPATTNRYAPLDAKAAGWQEQEDGSYKQTFTVKGVTAETEISADFYALVDDRLTVDEKQDISAALGCIGEIRTSADGEITLVCFSSAPEMDLSIVVQEVR